MKISYFAIIIMHTIFASTLSMDQNEIIEDPTFIDTNIFTEFGNIPGMETTSLADLSTNIQFSISYPKLPRPKCNDSIELSEILETAYKQLPGKSILKNQNNLSKETSISSTEKPYDNKPPAKKVRFVSQERLKAYCKCYFYVKLNNRVKKT